MQGARVGIHAAWTVITLLSVGVAGYAFFHVLTQFRFLELQSGFFSPLGLQAHIAFSAFAMLIGPFQFLRVLRSRRPRLHRWMGRTYVAACLFGGVAGAVIALYSTAGLFAGFGFLGLALFWLFTTAMAWSSALRRDFVAHERWMIRSFALTLAAVTLRLYLPVGAMTVGFDVAYPYIAWLCWVPNLLAAEIWIAMRRRPRRRPPAAVAKAA